MAPIILTFHGVGPAPRRLDPGEDRVWLEESAFEAALDCVVGRGDVALTFDDGNRSDVTLALPALRRRGLSATFFVCSGRIGAPGFLDHSDLNRLTSAGMRIGSHGVGHVPWAELDPDRLRLELSGSRSALAVGDVSPPDALACPFGSYNRTVLKAARAAGYRTIYTSDGGAVRLHDWLRPRNTVTRATTPAELRTLVTHGPNPGRQLVIRCKTFLKRHR